MIILCLIGLDSEIFETIDLLLVRPAVYTLLPTHSSQVRIPSRVR